jgi:hypothetical protein
MIPSPPFNSALFDKDGKVTKVGSEWLNLIWLASNSVTESGTTAQRPTANLWIGRPYFDLTLNYPVYVYAVTPSVIWKNAAGTTI